MEWFRVFSKKRILILIVMLFVNALFFARECSDVEVYKVYNNLINGFNKAKPESNIGKTASVVLQEYKKAHENSDEDETYLLARQMFIDKVNYVRDYSKTKEAQLKNAKTMLSTSLFSDKNSFSHLNAKKTYNDLLRIKDEKVTVSNGVWLQAVVDYKLVYYIIFLGIAMIVYSFIEDRKTGIIYIQHASAGGRGRLFVRRLTILFASTFVITIIAFAQIAVIALYTYGGVEGLGDSVCSDEMLAMCSMGLSRFWWLVVNVLRVALSMFVLGLMFWGILTYFNNPNIGLCAFLLFYGVEFIVYNLITEKSIFRVLKFLNISILMDSSGVWFTYTNWGYSYIVMGIAYSTMFLMVVIIAVSVVMLVRNCVLCNPLSRIGFVEKMFIKAYEIVMRLFGKMPALVMEVFKLVVSQKAGVIVIVVIVLFANMNKGYILKYNATMTAIVKLCEDNKDATVDELTIVRSELVQEQNVYKDELVQDSTALYRIQIAQDKIDLIDYVIQKNYEGVNVSLISPYEYEAVFGERQADNQEIVALFCIIIMLAVNSGALSYEKNKGMIGHIRAAGNRNRWIKRKILCNGIFASVIAVVMYGWYYYELIKLYRLEEFQVSVQSLRIFSAYPFDIPIWMFVLLDFVLKVIVLMAIGGIAWLISSLFRYEVSYLLSFMVIMPHFLYKLGINVLANCSVPRLMAFMPFWLEGRCVHIIVVDIILVVMGVTGYIYGSKCIITKNRVGRS